MRSVDIERLGTSATEVFNRVMATGEPVVVLRGGAPAAVVFPPDHVAAVTWLRRHDCRVAEDTAEADTAGERGGPGRAVEALPTGGTGEERALDFIVEVKVQDVHDGSLEGAHYFDAPFCKDARSVRIAFAAGVPDVRVRRHDRWISLDPESGRSGREVGAGEHELTEAVAAAVTDFYRARQEDADG